MFPISTRVYRTAMFYRKRSFFSLRQGSNHIILEMGTNCNFKTHSHCDLNNRYNVAKNKTKLYLKYTKHGYYLKYTKQHQFYLQYTKQHQIYLKYTKQYYCYLKYTKKTSILPEIHVY